MPGLGHVFPQVNPPCTAPTHPPSLPSLAQMVTRFFQQKRPLIVLIAGSACTGGRRGPGPGWMECMGQRARLIGFQVTQVQCCISVVCQQVVGHACSLTAAPTAASTAARTAAPAGKSTLAQQLASRLNMPNVLQTDVLYEVRQRFSSRALWLRAGGLTQ